MQLDFAFLAQYADYVSDGRMAIFGAGIDGIETSAVPFQANQMCIVAKFLLDREDVGRPHTYRIEVTGPNGERKIMAEDQPLNTEIVEKGRYPAGSNLVVNLLIQFSEFGQFCLHLMLDEEEVKRLPINVSPLRSSVQQGAQPEEVANG